MKIEIGVFEYKLSHAQKRVVMHLLDNKKDVVAPSRYYNHQTVYNEDFEFQFQFKKPTFKWLVDRNILISKEWNRFTLSPLVKIK